MKKVYIAGKITGEPVYACVDKFIDASYLIEEWEGYDFELSSIINPLRLPGIHFGIPHEEAMKICLEALAECTHALFLSDWTESKGAQIEHQYCLDNGIGIIYQEDL